MCRSLTYLLALALCAQLPFSSLAQSPRKAPVKSSAMRPYAFENRVRAAFSYIETERQKPKASRPALAARLKAVETELMQRLKEDRFVTDNTLRLLGQAWQGLEAPRTSREKSTYTETRRYISAVLPLLEGRSFAEGHLWMIRAAIYSNRGEHARAIEAYQEAANQYDPVHVDADIQRLYARLQQASLLLNQGKREASEPLLLEVMSYPFYNVRNPPESATRLRDFYLEAARNLIEARRGNVTALKDIHLFPMAEEELGLVLKQAIAQAEKK